MAQSSADLAVLRRQAQSPPWLQRLKNYQAINIVVVYGLLLVVCVAWSLIAPEDFSFATVGNLSVLARQIPITAIAAIGVGLLMISGEFDISIAGTFTLVAFIVAITLGNFGWALPVALAAGLVTAIAVGSVNGFITAWLGIPSFIATIGMMFFLRGVVRFVSINPQTNLPDSLAFFPSETFKSLLTGQIVGPISAQLVWLAVIGVAGYLILNRHQLGNHMFAAGGSRKNHRYVGVPGTVRGLSLAHEIHGSLAWRDLVDPAVRLAASGFTVHAGLARSLNSTLERSHNDEFRRVYLPEFQALIGGVAYDLDLHLRLKVEYARHLDGPRRRNAFTVQAAFGF